MRRRGFLTALVALSAGTQLSGLTSALTSAAAVGPTTSTRLYVSSVIGDDANSGESWAKAKATIVAAMASCVAGDIICVSQTHCESLPDVLASPGTAAAPVSVVSTADANVPILGAVLTLPAGALSTRGAVALMVELDRRPSVADAEQAGLRG